MRVSPFILAGFLVWLAVPTALADVSPWAETPGGAMRLITVPHDPDAEALHAVLEIRLDPGWKTYWHEPGDGGIPPVATLIGDDGTGEPVPMDLPIPERLTGGGATFAGYETGAQFVLTLDRTRLEAETNPRMDVFIGICADVCVPFQAEFPIMVKASDGDRKSPEHLALAIAKSRLADEVPDDAIRVERSGAVLKLTSDLFDTASELFLVNAGANAFGQPQKQDDGSFLVPVLREGRPEPIPYLVKQTDGAKTGRFALPD